MLKISKIYESVLSEGMKHGKIEELVYNYTKKNVDKFKYLAEYEYYREINKKFPECPNEIAKAIYNKFFYN